MKQVLYFDDNSSITLEEKSSSDLYYYRAPHDTERIDWDKSDFRYIPNTDKPWGEGAVRQVVRDKGKSLPEVYRFLPHYSVVLTEPLQLLWYKINAEISKEKWRTLLGSALAFTNNSSGFGGSECHADYVNKRNLDCKPPSFDFARFTGGAIFRGKETDNNIYIDYINVFRSLPTAAQLLANRHLWFYATSISPTGRIQYIMRLGIDGTLKRIRIPIYGTHDLYLPKSELHKLNVGEYYDANIVVYK
jgi:hypothetical protein